MKARFLPLIAFIIVSAYALSDGASSSKTSSSLFDVNVRIKDVKEQIQIYQNRAFYADREAQRLLSLDYYAYRRYLMERDRDLETVEALKQELAVLEQERSSLERGQKDNRSNQSE